MQPEFIFGGVYGSLQGGEHFGLDIAQLLLDKSVEFASDFREGL